MPVGDAPDVFGGVEDRVPDALADHLRDIALIDHHVHGAFNKPVDRAAFEASINEGSTDPVPDFMTHVRLPARAFHPALVRTAAGARCRTRPPTTTGRAAASSAPTNWPRRCCPRRACRAGSSTPGSRVTCITTPEQLAELSGGPVVGDPAARTPHRGPARGRDRSRRLPRRVPVGAAGGGGHHRTSSAPRRSSPTAPDFDIDWSRPTDADGRRARPRTCSAGQRRYGSTARC